jgi:hypothetical protein
MIWNDQDIVNRWLKVTVLANANTGLDSDDVFCFGNVVGETSGDGYVDIGDYLTMRSELGGGGGLGFLQADFDANGLINLSDFAIIRGAFGNRVQMPEAPAFAPAFAPVLASLFASAAVSSPASSVVADAMGSDIKPLEEFVGSDDYSPVRDDALAAATPISMFFTDLIAQVRVDVLETPEPAAPLYRTGMTIEDLRVLSDDLLVDGDGAFMADILSESDLVVLL